jgi:polar amino acid transport system substrate-binding protein
MNVRRVLAVTVAVFIAIGAAFFVMKVAGGGSPTASQPTSDTLTEMRKRGVLRAGLRTDFPPHSFYDAGGQWVGFDVDIADALARDLGVRMERVKVDELTRISYLKNGTIDVAVASMNHTLKRDNEIDFSQTYFFSYQTFLVRKGGSIRTLDDLVGKRVGFSRGGSPIGNWRDWLVAHAHPPADYVEFSDKQAAVQAVKQGAVDGFAEDYEAVKAFANSTDGLDVLTGQSIGVKQDGLGIRETDSKWRDAINQSIQHIWTSGEYERIYTRWFGPSTEVPIWPMRGQIEVWPAG